MNTRCTARVLGVPFVATVCLFVAVHGSAAAQVVEITTDSDEARALFERGRDAFHRAWFERADELLAEALGVDPSLAIGQIYKAAAESFLYFDSSERMDRAVRLAADATPGERLMVAAMAAFIEGSYESAANTLQQVVDRCPDDSYARHALGFTLVDLGLSRRGLHVLEQLVEDDPEFIAAWNHIGYAFLDLSDGARAEHAARKFVTEDPRNPSARDSLADVLSALGRTDEAVASLTRALLLENGYAYGMLHLGDLMVIEGDLHLARSAYRQSRRLAEAYAPSYDLVIRERIAGSWLRGLQFDDADTELEDLAETASELGDDASELAALRARMTMILSTGGTKRAAEVLSSYSNRVQALGDRRFELGEPAHLEFFTGWQAVAEGRFGDAEAAIAELEAAALHQQSVELMLAARLSGELALARLDHDLAIDAFEAIDDAGPLLALRLALAYDASGRPTAALALLETAASCESFDVECALARALTTPVPGADGALPEGMLPPPPVEPPTDEDPDDGSVAI